jgi:hypothetical protein
MLRLRLKIDTSKSINRLEDPALFYNGSNYEGSIRQQYKDCVLQQVKNKTTIVKSTDKCLENKIEACPKNDDPCDNSMHWIGKMNCNEEK